MSQSSQNGSKKSYIRDLQAYAWLADVMPDKEAHGRKFKRKDRQRGKKEIRDALREQTNEQG